MTDEEGRKDEEAQRITPLIEFGQGCPSDQVAWLRGRYIDLAEEFAHSEAYHDYEGFAGPEHTEEILNSPAVLQRLSALAGLSERYGRTADVIVTLLTHFAYENEDQGDHLITVDEALVFIDTMEWLLTCRFWMKKDAPEASEELHGER